MKRKYKKTLSILLVAFCFKNMWRSLCSKFILSPIYLKLDLSLSSVADFRKTTVWMHHIDTDKTYREKAWRELHKNSTSYIE